MIEVRDLLALPWATLLTLACGYGAYFIANVGQREHHKAIDVIFSVLVFGFPCAAVYRWLRTDHRFDEPWPSLCAVITALLIGALWSWFGRDVFAWLVRKGNISHSNDRPAAWGEIGALRGRVNCTQLEVHLTDGRVLNCDDASRFNDQPNGPFVLGACGDVLIYVTSTTSPEGSRTEHEEVLHDWGAKITYVPKEQVARVELRRQWRR